VTVTTGSAPAPAPVPIPVPTTAPTRSAGVPTAHAQTTARPGRLGRTPARLRVAMVVAVLACAAVAVAGLVAGQSQSRALRSAASDTAQQVRALQVRNDLVAADATATNAFLVGGREPVDQRARYDESLASATGGLTSVAGADADDARLLGPVSTSVATYSGLVEQARANNRQGFPVGAAYLETASQELRDAALPGIDEVVAAGGGRVDDAFAVAGRAMLALLVVGIALVVLVAVQVWLASRTHRRLNGGLVLATLAVLVGGFGLGSVLDAGGRTASDVRDGSYAQVLAVARAFSLANDAKAMESFTLIKRGSGQAFEQSYASAVAEAETLLATPGADPVTVALFGSWADEHASIRALDDDGDWDGAVALATSTDADSANARFDAFTHAAQEATTSSSDDTDRDLSRAAASSARIAWVALVVGLLGGVLAVWGFGPRLKEYR